MKEIKEFNNILEDGKVLLQINPRLCADLSGGDYHGWLFFQHPDGQWVTKRELKSREIMQAEDQRDQNIVIDAEHNMISRSGGARFG